jgi:hypothetical protein
MGRADSIKKIPGRIQNIIWNISEFENFRLLLEDIGTSRERVPGMAKNVSQQNLKMPEHVGKVTPG